MIARMKLCDAQDCQKDAEFKVWVPLSETDRRPIRKKICAQHARQLEDNQLIAPPFPLLPHEKEE